MATTIEPFRELNALLSKSPHEFLQPTAHLQQAAIQAAKALLDPLAEDIAQSQLARRDENRKKRKRGAVEAEGPGLQLRQVYTQGFGVKQVWEQAKRILDAACTEVQNDSARYAKLEFVNVNGQIHEASNEHGSGLDSGDEDATAINDIDDSEASGAEIEAGSDFEDIEEDGLNQEGEEEDGEEDIESEDVDIEMFSDDEEEIGGGQFIQDKHGLNDGFFSIDDFNKRSKFLEQMDVRGDEDLPSDEDEVDWTVDPMFASIPSRKSARSRDEDEGEDDDESEDGPTFGNADLDASSDEAGDLDDDDESDLEDAAGLANANEIRYADFFEPPPKKPSKTKRMRALPKTQPAAPPKQLQQTEDDLENDMERAMADVRRDLLDSEDEGDLSAETDESDGELGPRIPRGSDKNMSAHEKQRAAIAAEIRKLEAANVAKRDWQLSGEARAADRPLNSLIEEDLEFERAGKPVPVVTAETSEEIEQLIKRRILAREFDEVIRRLPGSIDDAANARRGRVEVDDTKPQASLGELYEQEHMKNSDPLTYVDKRSAATKRQHEQIDTLWREINEQLNALSNLHFKPKRVDVEMKTVGDKPRIAMEDARPVGDLEAGEGGMLAPQEVYKPGVDSKARSDEVIAAKSGFSVNREELSREEKLRRRRREKERSKKAAGNKEQVTVDANGKTSVKTKGVKKKDQEKADIISDLKKGNVKVIGKGGELQSIKEGKKGRGEKAELAASSLKL